MLRYSGRPTRSVADQSQRKGGRGARQVIGAGFGALVAACAGEPCPRSRRAPSHLVQQTVGHADLKTTSRYAHAIPNANESSETCLCG
jgi:hypothetical protein